MKLHTLSLSDIPVIHGTSKYKCRVDFGLMDWTSCSGLRFAGMDFGVNDDHSAIERPELEASWIDRRLEVCLNHLRCKLSVETELK